MSIYLIRHGKTWANERHIYCGSTDLSLSPGGRAELEMLHYELSGTYRFVTSGMKRANETLEILFGKVPYETDSRFREVDFGIFEMHDYEQLKDRADYQAWITGDDMANVPPQGESGNEMKQRALEAFSQLEDGTVLVAHGGVISVIMQQLFPDEGKHRYQWQPGNGRGYCIENGTYRAVP